MESFEHGYDPENDEEALSVASRLGAHAVDKVRALWQVDDEWREESDSGFTWWAQNHRQRVWHEPYTDETGYPVSKLCAATDFASDLSASPKIHQKISAIAMHASMAAPVFDENEGTLRLWTTMYVHEGNIAWAPGFFSSTAIVQPIEAGIRGEYFSALLGGKHDTSNHPVSGVRPERDDMLNVVKDVYAPIGKEPSRFLADEERDEIVDFLNTGRCFATGGSGRVSVEFSFGVSDEVQVPSAVSGNLNTSLVTATTQETHPQLGSGVLLRLNIAYEPEMGDPFECAARLNLLEAETFTTGAHLIGSWCKSEFRGVDVLTFVSFIPSALQGGQLLSNLIMSLGNRSKWAEGVLLSDS